ncbi:hypothetical protein WBG78_27750 [Chryseolinea sp. T2]|uniref:hypothetical protein n=1 Tax=Chryseolinea sp. T2 TaxID=3129255 RepID=UPI0030778070
MYWLSLFYILYLVVMLISMLAVGYSGLVSWFTTQYPDAYLVSDYSMLYFTVPHYSGVRLVAPWLILLLLSAIVVFILKRRTIEVCFGDLKSDLGKVFEIVRSSFADVNFTQRAILIACLILLLAVKVYFFATLPYQVDEVFNFVFFIDKGPLHISMYSNNHVLYNIISFFWWKLTSNPMLASRMTSILSGMAIHTLIYAMTKYFYDFKAGIFVLLLTGLTFWTNAYSAEGYSYTLMALCYLVSVISLLFYFKERRRGYALYILSSVLGFYCSKLFIIPFMSTVMAWMIGEIYKGQGRGILDIIFATLSVFCISTLLYLPMLLWSGLDAFFVTSMLPQELVRGFASLLEILSVMTEANSRNYWLIGMVLVSGCLIFFRRIDERLKVVIVLNITTILSIVLFILIFHVYPPCRAFSYTNTVFYILAAVALLTILKNFSGFKPLYYQLMIVTLLSIKSLGTVYILNYGWQNSPGSFQDRNFYERLAARVSDIFLYQPKSIFSDRQDEYLNFYLRLAAIREGRELIFDYDLDDLSKCDVYILHDPTIAADGDHVLIKEGRNEFGRIYVHKGHLTR